MSRTFSLWWRDFSSSTIAKHCAGLALLLLLFCAILTQLAIDWHTWSSSPLQNAARLASLKSSTAPLQGAGQRLAATRAAIENFSRQRIPVSYSQISSRIVQIGINSGVQLSHTTYDQRARGASLTEISIESQVSGTYPQIMRFVNGLERDQACFVIRAMTLTGQQGGEVNLQLRFSTWLRSPEQQSSDIAAAHLEGTAETAGKEIQ
ncbi:hypothetical protein [Occallatibacter savannae]|uniref:hypothetical protein n=1 Tax=Occallatibacter savannae TaxID=1002691 RepID=UPI000D68F585|nr:hypothetical protein [Occallatibacter savannae]